MRTLQRGDKGPDVQFAQRLHNNHPDTLRVTPLKEDGIFGQKTENAIRAFQNRVPPAQRPVGPLMPDAPRYDGVIDDAVWRDLGAGETVEHNVRLIAQHTENTCWHACMDMILGGGRCRAMPAGMLITDNSRSHGQLRRDAVVAYAAMLGGRAVPAPQTESALCDLIRSKAGVLIGTGIRYGGGHAMVLSGFYRDRDAHDYATIVRIHNPWEPHIGKIEGSEYPYMQISNESFTAEWIIAR